MKKKKKWLEYASKQLNYYKIASSLCQFDIFTQPFITGIVKECFDVSGREYMFEITIDGVNMVENERRTTQSTNVREMS